MPSSQPFRVRLLGASLLLGGVMLLRLLLTLVRSKLLALWLGPAGLGVIAQVSGVYDVITIGCTGGFAIALARFTAPPSGVAIEGSPTQQVITPAFAARTAFRVMVAAALVTFIVAAALSVPLAQWFVGNPAYAWLMAITSLCVPANVYYQYSLGLLQGAARVRSQVVQSAVYSVLWLVFSLLLVWRFDLLGGVWAIVWAWAGTALVSWWLLRRARLDSLSFAEGSVWRQIPGDSEALGVMSRYGGIALVGALTMSLTVVGMRAVLFHYGGDVTGGLYQVPVAVSNLSYGILVSALSGFVLPHVYRHIHHSRDLNTELETTLRLILAYMTPAALVLLGARHAFVDRLFSDKFAAAAPMIAPQLCADWLHSIVWWLALPLLPAGLYAVSFACELAALMLTLLLAWLLLPHFGLAGATIGTALAQASVLAPLWAFRARRDRLRLRPSTWALLCFCGALVFGAAWLTR